MEQSTSTGHPARYFDQFQQYEETGFSNYVSYPPTSSYLYNQAIQTQLQDQPPQSYDNSYNPVLTEYANQYYQQQQYYHSNKMQSKWNTKRKSPYTKPSSNNIFYCEVCKISCAGEQTYKEHCDGQKHKKKELNLKNNLSIANQKSTYFCELCQVPCSGLDSFNAHLNGKSHIKVCNLQAKLGKEVPADLIAPIMKQSSQEDNKNTSQNNSVAENSSIRVIGTPLVNFVKGECLRTMIDQENNSMNVKEFGTKDNEQNDKGYNNNNLNNREQHQINDYQKEEKGDSVLIKENNQESSISDLNNEKCQLNDSEMVNLSQSNTEPIGLEFIYEYSQPNSKATFYSCSLCNCKFSEIQAKEQHVRGRRHHKAFKTKSNRLKKSLIPEATSTPLPNTEASKEPELNFQTPTHTPVKSRVNRSNRPPSIKSMLNNINQVVQQVADENLTIEAFQVNMDLSFVESNFTEPKFLSNDNKYLFKKHSEIVPREDDLRQFYRHISNIERSLKQVSDDFLENNDTIREMLKLPPAVKQDVRILQGEIRAGLFGKKLLLRDENQIDLILFCSVKPTVPLLRKIIEVLENKLKSIEDAIYQLEENLKTSSIDVKAPNNLMIKITLTSLLIREFDTTVNEEQPEIPDQDELLDKQRMIDALCALRRFKWYQAKIAPYNPCPMLIRIFRDLTKRNPIWKPLTCWALELICERTMSNFLSQPTPAEAFKYILQTLGSGVLLVENKDDILIPDPCTIGNMDALAYLTDKQREEITESAQILIQFVTFNKIYKVLDTEILNLDNKSGVKNKEVSKENNKDNDIKDEKESSSDLVSS